MGYENKIENLEDPNVVDSKNVFIKYVNDLAVKTFVPNVNASNGSFGKRTFRLKASKDHLRYVDPILIIGTDGIGLSLSKMLKNNF